MAKIIIDVLVVGINKVTSYYLTITLGKIKSIHCQAPSKCLS